MRFPMQSLALALAAWAVVACEEDCNSLLQARAPVVQHTVVEQQEIAARWWEDMAKGTEYAHSPWNIFEGECFLVWCFTVCCYMVYV